MIDSFSNEFTNSFFVLLIFKSSDCKETIEMVLKKESYLSTKQVSYYIVSLSLAQWAKIGKKVQLGEAA